MKFRMLLCSCLAFLIFSGCQEEKVPDPILSLDRTVVSVGAESCFAEFGVTSNEDWRLLCSDDWVLLSPDAGKASPDPVVVTIAVSSNDSSDKRIATVNVYNSSLTLERTLTVKQDGCNAPEIVPELSVSDTVLELPAESGSKDISLQTNVEWTASVSSDWLDISPDSGNGSEKPIKIKLQYSENESETPRYDVIRISAGNKTVEIAVNQKAKDAVKPEKKKMEDGEYWIVAEDVVAMPVHAAYGYLQVEDFIDGTSTMSNAFTFREVGDGYYTIQDSEGKYYYQKGAYDSFDVIDSYGATDGFLWQVEPADDGLWKVMNAASSKFIQYDPDYQTFACYADERGELPMLVPAENPDPELTISRESIKVSYKSETFDIELMSNASWFAECDADWVTFSPSSGENTGASVDVRITVSENKSEMERSALLVFKAGSIKRKLEIVQHGRPKAGAENGADAFIDIWLEDDDELTAN